MSISRHCHGIDVGGLPANYRNSRTSIRRDRAADSTPPGWPGLHRSRGRLGLLQPDHQDQSRAKEHLPHVGRDTAGQADKAQRLGTRIMNADLRLPLTT